MSTVRISEASHRALRDLAERERISLQTVVERAIEHYRRRRFLETANKRYAVLRSDPEAWAQEASERGIWDQTLNDGQDDQR
jgi:predicted transcriptional regulator